MTSIFFLLKTTYVYICLNITLVLLGLVQLLLVLDQAI